MLSISTLLPPLSAKDRTEFEVLCADHAAAKALVQSCSFEARAARKRELKAQLTNAPRDKLLRLGAELETLDASFERARKGAKVQLRELGPRYVALFPRLLDNSQRHANELVAKAVEDWEGHFDLFDALPVGESPIVAELTQWKRSLAEKRAYIDMIASASVIPNPPTAILPYPTK